MDKLSREDEQRVISSLERVVTMTNRGTHPNDAIQKVAESERFPPPFIQRMVEAFNVSKSLHHFKTATGETKAASFPLADTVAILDKMYPEKVEAPTIKAASSWVPEELTKPEPLNFMKTAMALPRMQPSAYLEATEEISQKNLARSHGLDKVAESFHSAYRAKVVQLQTKVAEIASYFREIPHVPFIQVDMKTAAAYGEPGKALMDLVAAIGVNEKRAEAVPAQQYMVDRAQRPWSLIDQAIKIAEAISDAAEEAILADEKAAAFKAKKGLPTKQAYCDGCDNTMDKCVCKKACALDGVLSGGPARPFAKGALLGDLSSAITQPLLMAGTMGALGMKENAGEAARRKAISDVNDPIHEGNLRAATTQSMLNDFMANDPIISSYQPHEVTNAFNQLAKLGPNMSVQPAVMRGLLRRALTQEGVIEPHEAGQLADLENKLKVRETLQ